MYDPVCGMKIEDGVNHKTVYKKTEYCLCSSDCKKRFLKEPDKFLNETPAIELRDVEKVFYLGENEVRVLHSLSLKIWKGELVALVGVSGSGKTTAMNVMGLLDLPTRGEVFIDGRKTSEMTDQELAELRNLKLGFIFQQFNLLGALNCRENITLPLFFKKGDRRKLYDENVDKLIKMVGLEGRIGHKPLEMSGGEQQRVAIARALVDEPEIIFADEPTGNLDTKTSKMIMDILKDLNKQGRTLIIVTHDSSISSTASRVLNMKDGRLFHDDSGHVGKFFDSDKS